MTPLEKFRVAAALAHSIPGVTLMLSWCDKTTTCVSTDDNALHPKEFRHLVSGAVRFRKAAFLGGMRDVDVGGGLIDIGAGVYAEGNPTATTTRWIATFLHPDEVRSLAFDCPHGASTTTSIVPDQDLGVTLIALRSHDGRLHDLELAAAWINSATLAAETVGVCAHQRAAE